MLFLILNIFGFMLMHLFVKGQEPFALFINLAGKQRMLSQKMVKDSALILRDDTPELRKSVEDSTQLNYSIRL